MLSLSAFVNNNSMNLTTLATTAQALVAPGKGLLAMDESTGTCNARFAALGIPETVAARRAYRELLVTTPGLGEGISGAILFDETIRQHTQAGVSFVEILQQAGIIPGIKVDLGAHELAGFPGEQVTEGLDGLRPRLTEYAALGGCALAALAGVGWVEVYKAARHQWIPEPAWAAARSRSRRSQIT